METDGFSPATATPHSAPGTRHPRPAASENVASSPHGTERGQGVRGRAGRPSPSHKQPPSRAPGGSRGVKHVQAFVCRRGRSNSLSLSNLADDALELAGEIHSVPYRGAACPPTACPLHVSSPLPGAPWFPHCPPPHGRTHGGETRSPTAGPAGSHSHTAHQDPSLRFPEPSSLCPPTAQVTAAAPKLPPPLLPWNHVLCWFIWPQTNGLPHKPISTSHCIFELASSPAFMLFYCCSPSYT